MNRFLPPPPPQVAPLEEMAFHGFNAEHIYSVPRLAKVSEVPCSQPTLETINPKTCKLKCNKDDQYQADLDSVLNTKGENVKGKRKCRSPKEYLETFIFPVLLPGIARLLQEAKKEKCFEVSCFVSLFLNAW
ncbi:IQ domain-containing protein K [Camelus dromedarius]|uniref:IQ domain-containing protein K n=1 Tax=Camelus dromedarius TaxID=9838 RepID=A0A5N4CY86_CAMDR|nr:IQ domain-containing protein K [Camelus dromedarius]